MSLRSPNHTQVPNDLFDEWLPRLSESELKLFLVLIRQTLGYHRRKYRLSVRGAEKMTGLSHRTIQVAASGLVQKGLAERINDGGVTLWVIRWEDEPATSRGAEGGVLLSSTPDTDDTDENDDRTPSVLLDSTEDGRQVAQTVPRSVLPSSTPSTKEKTSKESVKERVSAAFQPPRTSRDQTPWIHALLALKKTLNKADYDTWVRDTEILSISNGSVIIGARNTYGAEWLREHVALNVAEALAHALGRPVKVAFEVAPPSSLPSSLGE